MAPYHRLQSGGQERRNPVDRVGYCSPGGYHRLNFWVLPSPQGSSASFRSKIGLKSSGFLRRSQKFDAKIQDVMDIHGFPDKKSDLTFTYWMVLSKFCDLLRKPDL